MAVPPSNDRDAVNDANRIILEATAARAKPVESERPPSEAELEDADPDLEDLLPDLSWKTMQWLLGLVFVVACVWFFVSVVRMSGGGSSTSEGQTLIPVAKPTLPKASAGTGVSNGTPDAEVLRQRPPRPDIHVLYPRLPTTPYPPVPSLDPAKNINTPATQRGERDT